MTGILFLGKSLNEWYPLAGQAGLVIAATEIEGVQHILSAENQGVPFSETLTQYSLDNLKQNQDPFQSNKDSYT